MWAPLGDLSIGVAPENATTYPHPGEVLWYPGGVSETELLIAYGRTHFASKAGSLAGNHFLSDHVRPGTTTRDGPDRALAGRAAVANRRRLSPLTSQRDDVVRDGSP